MRRRVSINISESMSIDIKKIALHHNTNTTGVIRAYINQVIINSMNNASYQLKGDVHDDDILTLSMEFDEQYHTLLKLICKNKNMTLKKFMSGIVLNIIFNNKYIL